MPPSRTRRACDLRMVRSRLSFIIPPLLLSLGTAGCAAAATRPAPMVPVERQAYAMGTTLTLAGEARSRAAGLEALEAGLAALAQVEDLLSTWRDDTPLAALNRAPVGEPAVIPPALLEILLRVREAWQRTGGAFDPAVGHLVAAWDLRGKGRTPGSDELARARQATGLHLLLLDPGAGTAVRQAPGPVLDAGGFGKGEGLARAAAALQEAGLRAWWIDFGGQVLVSGDGPGREVAIAHPDHRERSMGALRLRGLSAATSAGSQRPGHILDPRSGHPAPEFGSVTVVSADPFLADAASTALFVLGPEEGLDAARCLGVEALYLVRQGTGVVARATPGLHELITRLEAPLMVEPTPPTIAREEGPCVSLP